MAALWEQLRKILIGRRLEAAMKRNDRAADSLDAALREVLKR